MDLPGAHTDQLRSGKKVEKYLILFINIIRKNYQTSLHGYRFRQVSWLIHITTP